MGLVDLLLLGDGRAPVGSYAHSFGLESAVEAGDVTDLDALAGFVSARLATVGAVDATFAAAVHLRLHAPRTAERGTARTLGEADAQLTARTPSPALRRSSRELGRHLLRLAVGTWPDAILDEARVARPDGWLQPITLGTVGVPAGLSARDTASVCGYGLASGIASAGLRLLGLDPVAVHAMLAELGDQIDDVAGDAAAGARSPLNELPAYSAPLVDIRAECHAADPGGRLFAS